MFDPNDSQTGHPMPERERVAPAAAEYVGRPSRAAEARDAAAGFLTALRPAPPARTAQDLLLVVSELVTNALRHAGGVTRMRLVANHHSVCVIVEDPSPLPPQDRVPDLNGISGGFGWPLVRRLAGTVHVRHRPDGGKSILAALPR